MLQIKCFRRVSRGGKFPLHLFENWKLPLFEEKVPWLRPSVVKIWFKMQFLRVSRWKKRFWSCRAFLFRVLSESLSKWSNSKETPLSWLRAYVCQSALIFRTLPTWKIPGYTSWKINGLCSTYCWTINIIRVS